MELWLVGRCRNPDNHLEWEFMGAFDSKEKAIAACSEAFDFIAPATLNNRLPDESVDFEGAFYPLDPNETRGS